MRIKRSYQVGTFRLIVATLSAVLCAASSAGADNATEEKALDRREEEMARAFTQGNVPAMVAFWTAEGDYIDETGRHLHGRKAIEESFRNLFAGEKGAKLMVTRTSLRFLKPDVALA